MLYCDDCGSITDKNHGPEDGAVRCPGCAGATEESPATSGLSLLDEPAVDASTGTTQTSFGDQDLDLFSSETIAQKRTRKTPTGETNLRLVTDEDESHDSVEENFSSFEGSTPEPTSDRWTFECLACAGSLSIQAVETRSKLSCPRCQTCMVVHPDGEVSLPRMSTGLTTQQQTTQQQTTDAPAAVTEETPFPASPSICDETPAICEETPVSTPFFGEDEGDIFADDGAGAALTEAVGSISVTPPPVTAPSTAALEAADSKCSDDGEIITVAPPAEEQIEENSSNAPTLPTSFNEELGIETSLGFFDTLEQGDEGASDSTSAPQAQEGTELPQVAVQQGTVTVWTLLFTLPSLAALLVHRAGPGSEIMQTLNGVGISFQYRCGQFLDQVSQWIGGF